MFKEVSELCLAQGDGGLPTAVAFGTAPGESGIFVFRAQFQGGMHVSATPRRHHVCFQLTPLSRFDSHIADQALSLHLEPDHSPSVLRVPITRAMPKKTSMQFWWRSTLVSMHLPRRRIRHWKQS